MKNRSITDLTVAIELIDNKAWMGGTIYLQNLARCLFRLPVSERPYLLLLGDSSATADVLASVDQPVVLLSRFQRICRFFLRCLRYLMRRFRGQMYRSSERQIDVIYPGFNSAVRAVTTIRWIPDFQHRHMPELFSRPELESREASMAAVADTEGIVILSSRAALADFRQFFPMAKATPRVWSFHSLLKLSPLPENNALISQLNLPPKYLYVPNQFWAHKNHGIIFQALRILRDEFDLCVFLVCTGAQVDTRNSLYYEQLLSGLVMDGLQDQVRILGLLPRDQQLAILRSCAAVVQPSLFEGWSTVVEDVRAIGRPLFLSDIAVHREQMQDTAFFFNPHSAQALARLIAKYWPSLCSGPDEVMENAAQLASTDLVLASARAFSAICREAAQLVEYRANG